MKKDITLIDENNFTLDAEVTADRALLIKMVDGKVENIGLNIEQVEKILEAMYDIKNKVVYYDEPKKGYTGMWGEPVQVIGEQQMEHEGEILEQYIYRKLDYKPMNGKPFIALKANITLEER